jgi:hypothetical protein
VCNARHAAAKLLYVTLLIDSFFTMSSLVASGNMPHL